MPVEVSDLPPGKGSIFDPDLAMALVSRGYEPGCHPDGMKELPGELAIRIIDDLTHIISQLSALVPEPEEMWKIVDKNSKLH